MVRAESAPRACHVAGRCNRYCKAYFAVLRKNGKSIIGSGIGL
jgi:hypothetical protein